MNGLTATGVTVGICAGLWQLVSSHVGLSQGWELLGTIGFVAFCSFYAAGGGKSGFIRSLAVNYSGMVWAFFAALAAGWLASVSGISGFWASVITTVPGNCPAANVLPASEYPQSVSSAGESL